MSAAIDRGGGGGSADRSRGGGSALARWAADPGVRLFLLFTVALLVGLELLERLGLVRPIVYSGPIRTMRMLGTMAASGELWIHIGASLQALAIGYGAAVLIGIPVGIAMGVSRTVDAVASPYMTALYVTPKVALLPLVVMIAGFGLLTKVSLVCVISVFPIVLSTWTGVRNVEPALVKVGRSFCFSRMEVFQKIVVPHALAFIVVGLRLGATQALIGVFVAEMWGADAGVGSMVIQAGVNFDAPKVFVGILVFAVLGIILTEGLRYLETALAPWRQDVSY